MVVGLFVLLRRAICGLEVCVLYALTSDCSAGVWALYIVVLDGLFSCGCFLVSDVLC